MGSLCYPTQAPGTSWYFSQKAVTVQGVRRGFCHPGTSYIEARGVSRYKVDAKDILITMQNAYGLQWRDPGLSPLTKLSLVQYKSKTCDKPINFIVRVSTSNYFIFTLLMSSTGNQSSMLPYAGLSTLNGSSF